MSVILGIIAIAVTIIALITSWQVVQITKEEREYQKEKVENEIQKNEMRESLNTGNPHDDVSASLDLLRNNKQK